MAIDGEYEFEAAFCITMIAYWKKRYFRKNAKKPCRISLRCWYGPLEPGLWKYYLEYNRGDGVKEQTRICKEAYEYLKIGKHAEERGMVEFITMEIFEPPINIPHGA